MRFGKKKKKKNLSGEKKLLLKNDTGLVTITSVILNSKSLLQKQIYGNFEKPETQRKWSRLKMKSMSMESVWSFDLIEVKNLDDSSKR